MKSVDLQRLSEDEVLLDSKIIGRLELMIDPRAEVTAYSNEKYKLVNSMGCISF